MNRLIFIIFIFISFNANADGFKSPDETKKFSDLMINTIYKEQFKKAFNSAKPYWPIPSVEIDGIVNKINQQWPIISQRFGKPMGVEYIRKETIGKSFIRYYYLHKFTNHAIYWQLDYYKANKNWKLDKVLFKDDLDVLFE
jgi:hypothetical protein